MPKTVTPETTETVAEVQPISTKRQFAATSVSMVVGVALTAATGYVIGKVTTRVHDTIAPPAQEANTTSN